MLHTLLFILKVLAAYCLMFILFPAWASRLKGGERILIPATRSKYTAAALAGSLVLYTAVPIIMMGGAAGAGLRVTPDAVRLGLIGTAMEWVLLCLFMVGAAGQGKAQAMALGLEQPRDFWVHATWYAFIWSGFREEIFHRGLVQGLAADVLPGGWALLVPVLVFAFSHFHNSGNLALALVWVTSTIPGGLIFGALYHSSDSLVAPVLTHGLNNAAAGLVTAVAVFRPRWALRVTLSTGVAGAVYLTWQWTAVRSLVQDTWVAMSADLAGGAVPGILTAAVLIGSICLMESWRQARVKQATRLTA